MTGGTIVPVNQLVQDMGVSGNGYVELSAVDGANGVNAPYIQTNTWTSAPVGGEYHHAVPARESERHHRGRE